MTKNEIIKEFLTDSSIEFIEHKEDFYLPGLSMTLPVEHLSGLPKMAWSMLAMEIGINKLSDLVNKLKPKKGSNIYEFQKETD